VPRAGTVSTSTPTERSASGVGGEENVIAINEENHPKPTGVASGNIPSPLGACDGGVETLRIRMTLTTGIPVERCQRVDLGHAGHRASDSWR
jgi:hypothetical protein